MDTRCDLCKKHIRTPLWGETYYKCKLCDFSMCMRCEPTATALVWCDLNGRERLLCLKCRNKNDPVKQNGANVIDTREKFSGGARTPGDYF